MNLLTTLGAVHKRRAHIFGDFWPPSPPCQQSTLLMNPLKKMYTFDWFDPPLSKKLKLDQNYAFIKKSTIFMQSLQNLAKMWYSLVRLFVFTKFPNDWKKLRFFNKSIILGQCQFRSHILYVFYGWPLMKIQNSKFHFVKFWDQNKRLSPRVKNFLQNNIKLWHTLDSCSGVTRPKNFPSAVLTFCHIFWTP